MKNKYKIIMFCMIFLVCVSVAYASLGVYLSDQGTDVKITATDTLVNNGNLTVRIYDAATGGNKVYEQNFTRVISSGAWNIMLNESLNLEYGKKYWKDYLINGEDLDFGGEERLAFYSPLGDINTEDLVLNITLAGNVTINESLNVKDKLNVSGNITSASWINGLFNWSVLSGFLSFTGSVLDFSSSKLNATIRGLPSGNTTAELTAFLSSNRSGGDVMFSGGVLVGDTGGTGYSFEVADDVEGLQALIRRDATTSGDEALLGFSTSTSPTSVYTAIGQIRLASGKGDMVFKTGSGTVSNLVEKMRITSDGLVGINTSTPTYRLEVNGNISLNNTLYVQNSGNVGIGTTTPTDELNVVGNANITGTTTVDTLVVDAADGPYVSFAENGHGAYTINYDDNEFYIRETGIDTWLSIKNTSGNTTLHGLLVDIDQGDLKVAGDINVSGVYAGNFSDNVRMYPTGNTTAEIQDVINGTNIDVLDVNTSSATIHGDLNVTGKSYLGTFEIKNDLLIGNHNISATDINFSDGSNNGFFFDHSANKIGIGTTTPTDELNVVGNANFTSNKTYTGGLFVSPLTVSGLEHHQDNWNPAGLDRASLIILGGQGLQNGLIIGGIESGTSPTKEGRIIYLLNDDPSNSVILSDDDSDSSAANRFQFAAGTGNITLSPYEGITLVYSSARWHSFS